MTREEAIEVLQASSIKQMSLTKIIVNGKALSVKIALEMAIKALEQEPILDKMKAEIKALPRYGSTSNRYLTVYVDIYEVLSIIDKYRGGT